MKVINLMQNSMTTIKIKNKYSKYVSKNIFNDDKFLKDCTINYMFTFLEKNVRNLLNLFKLICTMMRKQMKL